MKIKKKSVRNKECGMRNENEAVSDAGSIRNSPAFTLIELLTVISIIALLAAFSIPVLKTVAKKKILDRTHAEMAQLETAIERYKTVYGFYPPSNAVNPSSTNDVMFSPLYYELLGTTNNNNLYQTLDGSASISTAPPSPTDVQKAFGVGGFINCSKSGATEDAPPARNFLPGLKPNQFISATNHTVLATIFVASVGGPDQSYCPFYGTPGCNPWRYVSPGVNNPNSYDLWIQLSIGSSFSSVNNFTDKKTYLICNWTKQVLLNNPLP
jgi:prepilin-type N-terminal cleavage/methylation domain-containing protein